MAKKLLQKIGYMILAAFICAGFYSCSEDESENGGGSSSPGTITAVGATDFTAYSMRGELNIRIKPTNADAKVSTDKFGFTEYEEISSGSIESGDPLASAITFKEVKQNEDGSYMLVAAYDWTGIESKTASCKITYAGTETSIPLTLECRDAIRLGCSPLAKGLKGRISAEAAPGEDALPEGLGVSKVQASGAHATNVAFDIEGGIANMFVELDDLFQLTSEEQTEGKASIPVEVTLTNGDATFYVDGAIEVNPSYALEKAALPEKSKWNIQDALDQLGVEYRLDTTPIELDRLSYFISNDNGPLITISQFGKPMFPAFGVEVTLNDEGAEVGRHVSFRILGADKLAEGSYTFVIRMKKVIDASDNRYVDIVIPFTK